MNYKTIYEQLVKRGQQENRQKNKNVYYEEHHIIPKCINGSNDTQNLVLLTAREHFIAHWLLTKIYPNEPKIIFAFNSFSMKLYGVYNATGQLDKYCTSTNYEYARQKVIKLLRGRPCSEKLKNVLFDTTYINNGVENKRIKNQDLQLYIDNGWIKGRIKYKRKSPTNQTRMKISQSNKGRKASQGSINFFKNNKHYWLSKNNKTIQVFEKDLQKYLDEGWIRGRHCLKKEKSEKVCYFSNNNLYVEVPLKQKAPYESHGWIECTETEYNTRIKNKQQNTLFKYWVNKDNKSFRICEQQKDIYLELGFKLGRGKRRYN